MGVAGLAAAAGFSRAIKLRSVSPALRSRALALMPPIAAPLMPFFRYVSRRMASRVQAPAGVTAREHHVPLADHGDIRVLELRRADRVSAARAPALLWLHGGGYVMGTPEMDMALLARILDSIDIVIFSVDYRLAPNDPFPAALDDAADTLNWVLERAGELGIDLSRIAVGGNSAGGGLAAGLAQRAHDDGISLAFQLLMYPMIDDRTVVRRDHAGRGKLVWTPGNNRHGWSAYLAAPPGEATAPAYAAPARREDLHGLAPAWIGVGTLDLFHDEDVAYAERLRAAQVPCTLSIVDGAPHIFDVLNFDADVVRKFHENMIAALSDGLGIE